MRTTIKKAVRIFLIITLVIVILIVPFLLHRCQSARDKKELFLTYQNDFSTVNSFFLNRFGYSSRTYWIVEDSNGEISALSIYPDNRITIDEEVKKALSNIKNAFRGLEFSTIEVTPDAIFYIGGMGNLIYGYARNDEKPQPPIDGVIYVSYKLDENWYLFDSINR